MNPVPSTWEVYLQQFFFGIYPYLCMAVFLIGSLARFDRDQYTWKSDSSQLLRHRSLRLGSNLFHAGVLFLLLGHAVGMLTPHAVYAPLITAAQKQMLAIVAGGVAGGIALVGLSILLWRRWSDPRIRLTSRTGDLAILAILWIQLVLGLATLPPSLQHADGTVMMALADWAQHIVTFRPMAEDLSWLAWPYKLHMVLGMTIFLVFPFTRLVHVWSGLAAVAYLFRPWQLVRSRRLQLPPGHERPQRALD